MWEKMTPLHLTLGTFFMCAIQIPFHREKANLAITLHNDHEEIMAQATFLDYPNWNVTKQDDWVSVFQELDSEIPCTVGNRARGLLEQPELGRDVLGLHMLSFQFWE